MEDRKNGGCISQLLIDVLLSVALWVTLIILKAAGTVDMHWALVLSGIVWISWSVLALSALAELILFAIFVLVTYAVRAVTALKRRIRRRKCDRRIIRQAKAAGVWNKPRCLGGRALELKAWKEYRIKRLPGEKDKELRVRYWRQLTTSLLAATKSKAKDGKAIYMTIADEKASETKEESAK